MGNAEIPPMEDTCRMCPEPCSRRNGSAAWVIHSAPKRLVSSWLRTSASDSSSTMPKCPYPALLTTTSSLPNRSWAFSTAANAASRSVTSRRSGRSASPYLAPRSSSVAVSRAVAATESPRSRAAMAHSRPKPRDAPVMNQILLLMVRAAADSARLFRGDPLDEADDLLQPRPHDRELPLHLGEVPVDLREVPVDLREAPVDLGEAAPHL